MSYFKLETAVLIGQLMLSHSEEGQMILADKETKVDLLYNEAIAATIIGLLHER